MPKTVKRLVGPVTLAALLALALVPASASAGFVSQQCVWGPLGTTATSKLQAAACDQLFFSSLTGPTARPWAKAYIETYRPAQVTGCKIYLKVWTGPGVAVNTSRPCLTQARYYNRQTWTYYLGEYRNDFQGQLSFSQSTPLRITSRVDITYGFARRSGTAEDRLPSG